MTARQRITDAAGGGQPVRVWELDQGRSSPACDAWMRADGYRVDVRYDSAGVVRSARLTSPGGGHCWVFAIDTGKVDRVLAWLSDPTAHLVPAAPVP